MNLYFLAAFDNDNTAYVPQRWAMESIAILEENMVIANLIHRDFSSMVASFGDTVNTRKPNEFTMKRKTMFENIEVQDATAVNVPVVLNQHPHVSFPIYDEESAKSFKDLVNEYLKPAMIAQARGLDRIVLGQYPRFFANTAGKLNGLTNSNSKRSILDTRLAMNLQKAPEGAGERNLIWTPYSETEALDTDIFLTADKVGDDGTALREASLGRKLGFDHWMSQNMGYVDVTGLDSIPAAVNNTGGYGAGATVIAIDGAPGIIPIGTWVTIAGDMQPRYVTAKTDATANTTSITLNAPLKYAVADDAVVTFSNRALVNNTANYAAGYSKYIDLDGFTSSKFIQIGQIVSTGTVAARRDYAVIDVINASGTNQSIMLDRPLEVGIDDGDPVFPGPAGAYNLAFNRNALALVMRPLPQPVAGVNGAVVSYNNMSVRVVIGYDIYKQAHIITIDYLCGIALLEKDLGTILLG